MPIKFKYKSVPKGTKKCFAMMLIPVLQYARLRFFAAKRNNGGSCMSTTDLFQFAFPPNQRGSLDVPANPALTERRRYKAANIEHKNAWLFALRRHTPNLTETARQCAFVGVLHHSEADSAD